MNLAAGIPDVYPTYDLNIRTNGLNEADEMNLYRPNALMDSPYGPTDLEWLYRSQDVDGPSLLSRLADLAPISFTNTIDGQRRRRLFAVESWELNNFVWTNDNPGNAFPNNTSFSPSGNRSLYHLHALSPGQTIGGRPPGTTISVGLDTCRRMNGRTEQLNVLINASAWRHQRDASYSCPGPSRQEDQPQLSPAGFQRSQRANPPEVDQRDVSASQGVLPPLAVDTPEELAQLSQFVINIIDFRDPDCTMTHWQNPDVTMAVWDGRRMPWPRC